ncbi:MAG: hypothetical protein HOW73_26830 [Polyangiaceae bacterium]|nr:hypothetical protein [Polyangiaceae bacterium]
MDQDVGRCPCGYDKGNVMVSPNAEYGFWGWVLVLIGISAEPKAIKYTCRRCGTTIERTTDPVVLKETRVWG